MAYNFLIRIIGLFLIVALTASCDDDGKRSKSLLPKAAGNTGEILVLMDSTQWKGKLGEIVKKTFQQQVPGLNRDEPTFSLKYVDPRKMTSLLKKATNLMYITTFDKNTRAAKYIQRLFTKESRAKIKTTDDYFLTTTDDVYAKGQSVVYLFGRNEELLINNIKENEQRLVDFFNKKERERLDKKLFRKANRNIKNTIAKKLLATVKVPENYELAMLEDDFAWIRWMEYEIDKNIWITHMPYYDKSQFTTEEIIKLRDRVAKKYLYEDKENIPDSYIITETEVPFIPVTSRQINFNGRYAVETRGLWRIYNHSMGGPFIGISVVDEDLARIYYIEGFAIAIGKPHREIIRELETILYSFKSSQDVVSKMED